MSEQVETFRMPIMRDYELGYDGCKVILRLEAKTGHPFRFERTERRWRNPCHFVSVDQIAYHLFDFESPPTEAEIEFMRQQVKLLEKVFDQLPYLVWEHIQKVRERNRTHQWL